MQTQIKPSVRNTTIAKIYQDLVLGKLVLAPDFQRRFFWTHEHQENFIDTIIKGYPFPEIYVYQGGVDIQQAQTTQYVIDGQQRLTTIKRYIEGKQNKALKNIPKFQELSNDKREKFCSYQIVVRDIGKVNFLEIEEIFRRLNLTKFKPEDVEIHNTIYDGNFIQTAKDILNNVDSIKFSVFQGSELTRIADLHFILLVMATIENKGYFARDEELENYIAQFNDKYPNKNHIKSLIIKTFTIINDLNLPIESIWFIKSNFFTLVLEIAKNIDNIPDDFRDLLITLEKNILNDKQKDNDFGLYYGYISAGTNHRKSRVERAKLFNQYIFQQN
ncbi:MAG: DUF262 domain-containing protein [Xenococcus sp. (in: cyanobacteria)]